MPRTVEKIEVSVNGSTVPSEKVVWTPNLVLMVKDEETGKMVKKTVEADLLEVLAEAIENGQLTLDILQTRLNYAENLAGRSRARPGKKSASEAALNQIAAAWAKAKPDNYLASSTAGLAHEGLLKFHKQIVLMNDGESPRREDIAGLMSVVFADKSLD